MADQSDRELLEALGVEIEVAKPKALTARQERIIAGFEDIQKFYEDHGRPPLHGEERDIFERLYAVRLDRIRELPECRELLEPLDTQGLLGMAGLAEEGAEFVSDAELLAGLGVTQTAEDDITVLKHVRSREEVRAAEEIANRTPCADFSTFKPLFAAVKRDLETGARTTRPFVRDAGFSKAEIKAGQFFILGGLTAYVAEVGESFRAPNGETDSRLRVIYDNGTESDLLLRSLQRALYKDDTGRRISEPEAGPLFADTAGDEDSDSGTIYVLQSLSDHPLVAQSRQLIHKIGVTGGDVERRIARAPKDATYLLADVEIVATFRLYNINRTKLENLIHRIFAPAQFDIEIEDRMGVKVRPREWFLVPLPAIDEAVSRIRDGSIENYVYDPAKAALVPIQA